MLDEIATIYNDIHDDLRKHLSMGEEKYSLYLKTQNKDSALWDAYQTTLALLLHLRQAILERELETAYVSEGLAEYVLTLFPKNFVGVCVDIGAYDPFWLSNSWLFEKHKWDTYCIEPNPSCIPKLKQFRKNVLEFACDNHNSDSEKFYVFSDPVVGEASATGLIDHRKSENPVFREKKFFREIKVRVRTLDYLMQEIIKKDHIDFLSIDVECSEFAVLGGTSLNLWKPKVLAIEDFENGGKLTDYLSKKNYRLVHRIMYNNIYILNDYYPEVVKLNA